MRSTQRFSESKAPLAIAKHLSALNDPRVDRTKHHPLLNVIVMALLGVICGAEGWDDLED
ncbi:MAG: transposase family protein [Polyangiales bacterium]